MLANAMTTSGATGDLPEPYEIVVRGELDEDLLALLDAQRVVSRSGKTLIVFEAIDQAHLQGVLASLHDHNLKVERVNPI
jgi:hypothetical protein